MPTKMQHLQNLCQIFTKSVESVLPKNLLSAANNYNLQPLTDREGRESLQIQGKEVSLHQKRCYVVGFGKAVLGMAVQLERALEHRLTEGVISIPLGTLEKFRHTPDMLLSTQTSIKVIEGAPNNQPDDSAQRAAVQIKDLASRMGENDVLFVLISGGGSALLPLPRPPLSLTEKMHLIKRLANAGATIDEMNVVRIALSDIKGGRLAAAARNASAAISFVISDIVGDPVDLIASGPTCPALAKRSTPQEILEKYRLWDDLSLDKRKLIQTPVPEDQTRPGNNSSIYVVGDNRVATATAVNEALNCGFNPFIASTTVQGDVHDLTEKYIRFLEALHSYRTDCIDEDQLRRAFPFDGRNFEHFLKTLKMCQTTGKPLLLICAGEPTVEVTGSGVGGRNQELALRMSLACYEREALKDVKFLSAGTDGIDGPTPAAGALGCCSVLEEYLKQKDASIEKARAFVRNNDSYNFYKNLNGGRYHIMTGHTGTNVMDLQLLLVS